MMSENDKDAEAFVGILMVIPYDCSMIQDGLMRNQHSRRKKARNLHGNIGKHRY